MSTPNEPINDRHEETNQVRVTHEERMTHVNSIRSIPQRNLVLVVTAVAVFTVFVILFAYFWLRPTNEIAAEAPAPAASTGTVKFLMEQQWLIRMKLALVEEQTVARQITATGRVIPSANSQALVAPPVGRILSGRTRPRVGQHVGQGQTIAVG